jgi:hypothetical protein
MLPPTFGVRVYRNCCVRRVDPVGRGPRRALPTNEAALRPKTLAQYRRLLMIFLGWLNGLGLEPESAPEYDDLLIEFRYGAEGAAPMTKGNFEHLVSAVERVCPHFKGQLALCKAEINQWRVIYETRHSVPLTPSWAHLLALGCLQLGIPAVGALILLQSLSGMRPSEAIGLTTTDVVLPSANPHESQAGHLLLGVKVGTKARRPQAVRVVHQLAILLMAALRTAAVPGGRLTHLRTLGGLSYCMGRAAALMHLNHIGWRPHSGRSGYVTWRAMEGDTPEQIMSVTRHVSLASFKVYLDVTAVAAGRLSNELLSKRDLLAYSAAHVPKLLVRALLTSAPIPAEASLLPDGM